MRMKRDGGPIFWDGSPFGTEDLLARLAQGCGGGRGERPAGRDAQLRALKKEAAGRMQRPPELVPIPEYLLGTSGRLRKVAAFWKNPENIWSKLKIKFYQKFKIQQTSGKICEIL